MKTETDVLFISHGGGPMPLLGDPGHRENGGAAHGACLQASQTVGYTGYQRPLGGVSADDHLGGQSAAYLRLL